MAWYAEALRVQGIKLYYRVLEAMLRAEDQRAPDEVSRAAAISSLLISNSFHKCLLACAFELVVSAYKMVSALPIRLSATSQMLVSQMLHACLSWCVSKAPLHILFQ